MTKKEIKRLYKEEKWTLRRIAEKFNTNHHLIKRKLLKMGIEIMQGGRIRKPFTEEHKRKIGASSKGRIGYWAGKKMPKITTYKNMLAHLKYDISLEWLMSFEDIEKLKYLNKALSRKRDCQGFTTEIYKAFIERFYKDKQFNILYDKWIATKDKWIKPSLDHILSKSKGGKLSLENLQFISWLENRAKVDMDQEQWNKIKKYIGYYL